MSGLPKRQLADILGRGARASATAPAAAPGRVRLVTCPCGADFMAVGGQETLCPRCKRPADG